MWQFAVALPLMFAAFGAWSIYLGARSWNGQGVRPSTSVAFASGRSARVRGFVDRCIIPLGLLYLSAGITLGLTAGGAWLDLSASRAFGVAIDIGAAASVTFLVLTVSVYRSWKPRRLIPAYLRLDVHRIRPETAQPDTNR